MARDVSSAFKGLLPESQNDGNEQPLKRVNVVDLKEAKNRPSERVSPAEKEAVRDRFFLEAKNMTFGDQEIVVNDLKPPRESGNPVVFVPGYYAEGDSFVEPMLDMYFAGRRVICHNSYHGIDPMKNGFMQKYMIQLTALQKLDPQADIMPQARKAALLIDMLDQLGLKNVDLVAHSEGAIVGTMAAFLRPDLFAKKAFLNPAGLRGKEFRGTPNVMLGKVRDDALMMQRRVGIDISNVQQGSYFALTQLLPQGTLDKRTPIEQLSTMSRNLITQLPTRKVSPRYNKGQGPRVPGDIGAEYAAGDKELLQKELDALSWRGLENWLPLLNTSTVAIAASDMDQVCPALLIRDLATKAGITEQYKIPHAFHNFHHFEQRKMWSFLEEAVIKSGEKKKKAA